MSELTKAKTRPVQLDAKDGDGCVTITPASEDRFVRSIHWTIEACQLGLAHEVRVSEVRAMLDHVSGWIHSDPSGIQSCAVGVCDGQINIFIVPQSATFDFNLNERITALDINLAEKFQAFACEVLQIPARAPEAFVDCAASVHVYGDPLRTPSQVAP